MTPKLLPFPCKIDVRDALALALELRRQAQVLVAALAQEVTAEVVFMEALQKSGSPTVGGMIE